MSGDKEAEIELPGMPGEPYEAATFRIGLAMAITMVAEIANDQGAMPGYVLDELAGNLIELNDKGKSFVAAHVNRMSNVKIVPADPETEEG